jgi:hypothetical protein
MIKIRPANFDTDALAIVDGAREFSQSTSLASWFRSGNEFVEDVSKLMVLDNLEITVAEHEGKIVGGIGIVYVPFIWNHSILVGDELFWWTKNAPFKTGTALFDFAMKRIEEKGARPMFRSLDTSPKHIEKFYEQRGLKKFESIFSIFTVRI